jgi:hypothetical protein
LIPRQISQRELEKVLAKWARGQAAELKQMGRLARPYKSRGDGMHWHLSGIEKGMGTVEVTYLPSSGKLTVLVHDNRRGKWAGRAYKLLAQEIARTYGP